MNQKIIFLILLILVVAGFFGFWYYREGIFSKEILKLEILGPEMAKTGEEIEYTVKYKNNGNFVLEQPKLIFEMPENSLAESGKTRITQNLNDIYPGDEEFVKIKARLLGKDGDLKIAKASLSYAPKNITAPYESDTTFTTKIESTPINLDFDLPTKLEKQKEVQYAVNYFSNIDFPLENLSVKIDSISGFNIESSDPVSLDKSEWKLKTLNKAEGGRINIQGRVSADSGRTLTFSAKLGIWQDGNFVVIKEASKEVEVIDPLLFISQQINGSIDYVPSPGETLNYQIFFRNIGSTPFENLFVIVKLDGLALDMSTINAYMGQVQPSSNMIVWDSKQVSQLRKLGVQQEGELNFSVKLKDSWTSSESDGSDSIITNDVNISQITQKFTTKVSSGLTVSQKAFYQNSVFSNSGPIPPKAGQATTYTITWDIKNYFSDVKNVKVKAILPQNVSLTGQILPQQEFSKFSFDSASREIVWSAGDILKGAGTSANPLVLHFQISLLPQGGQSGFSIPLMGQTNITGENQFTGTAVSSAASAVNTSQVNDLTVLQEE